MTNIKETIICSGFGGQGLMTLGKVLANAGMISGLKVTWFPSYGAEVRGGTAHAIVRISTEAIGSPLSSTADTAIIMNEPSLEKFENRITPGGLMILNTSMTGRGTPRDDIETVEAPLTEEAIKLGNVRVANMIAAGILTEKKPIFSKDVLIKAMEQMAAGRKDLLKINIKAVTRGIELAGA